MEPDPDLWAKMRAALDAYQEVTTDRTILEPHSTTDEQYRLRLDCAVAEARTALLEMERRSETPENWVPFALKPSEVGMLIGTVTHRLRKQQREYVKPKQIERRATLEAEGRSDVAIKAIHSTEALLARLHETADAFHIPHGPTRRQHEYVDTPRGCGVCGEPQRDTCHYGPHPYEPGFGRKPYFGCGKCGAQALHPIHTAAR